MVCGIKQVERNVGMLAGPFVSGALWVYLALAVGLVAAYVMAAGWLGETGFPLDDAWIHQTYARNLALTGRWEYVRGQVSAGSTAPLWTALLAVGYLLRFPYQWWAWGLGVLLLALTGRLAHKLAGQLFPQPGWLGPAVGLLCVGEWRLVWAAASGMETLLYVALELALLDVGYWVGQVTPHASRLTPRALWAGLLAGLLVLTRPEGVVLVGLLGLWGTWLAARGRWPLRRAWRAGVAAALPLVLLVVPYLLFNFSLSGRWWPNTFYAKQTEYATLLALPFLVRLGRVALPLLAGFQVLLVPGLVYWILGIRHSPVTQYPSLLLPILYSLLHLLLYALRLPVTYQHGRYLMPVIPLLILIGVGGTARWLRPRHPVLWRRVLSRAWPVALGVTLLAFLAMGARAYARDVQVIQSEMVAVSHWLAENTEPDEWVAAHDIGAMGYFAGRPILDLAGLISPDVIPLMDDEATLAGYILAGRARYLVTAPGWPYQELTGRPEVTLLYSADSPWTAAEGLDSSAVYRLPAH